MTRKEIMKEIKKGEKVADGYKRQQDGENE